jgi:hypothetical protein
MEEKKQRGGARVGGGRPTKADELKANAIFINALKVLYKQDLDDDNKIAFVVDLLDSQRGQIFVAEHIFGKPKEIVETTLNVNDFNIKDYFKIGND